MNKTTQFSILGLIVIIGGGFYFLRTTKSSTDLNSVKITYEEPTTTFSSTKDIPAGSVAIKVTDLGFEPVTLYIKKGQTVVFLNSTKGFAWPASNPHPTHTNYPEFDPELPMKVGQSWKFTFEKAGVWGYHDHLDPARRGTINVSE